MPMALVYAIQTSVTEVACSISTVSLAQNNPDRLCLIIMNDTNKDMYLRFGPGASLLSFSLIIPKDAVYEVPSCWTGEVTAVWKNPGTGFARVTELSR